MTLTLPLEIWYIYVCSIVHVLSKYALQITWLLTFSRIEICIGDSEGILLDVKKGNKLASRISNIGD